MSKPRAIFDLLENQFSGELEQTIRRSNSLRRLSDRLQTLLDSELAEHCHLLNVRDGLIIIACDSTAWATRLRYQIPTLLEALRQLRGLDDIRDIQVRIQPSSHTTTKAKSRATLSSQSAYCIRECANSITDSALQQALKRLAEHQNKNES
ncbi:MAG: DUF721 domain-containing protein [Gammaproteobacteria bacterium]|nr:DUF721 domain-containing protein [Gammaproteobacteria bacterium]